MEFGGKASNKQRPVDRRTRYWRGTYSSFRCVRSRERAQQIRRRRFLDRLSTAATATTSPLIRDSNLTTFTQQLNLHCAIPSFSRLLIFTSVQILDQQTQNRVRSLIKLATVHPGRTKGQCTSNKLYSVQPVIGRNRNPSLSRYDSVLNNRLRVGHTRLTNSYLLKRENQPECQICHSPLTVKHILIDCICFSAARQMYFGVNTLKELFFENLESRNIVAFIKHTNFYHCI